MLRFGAADEPRAEGECDGGETPDVGVFAFDTRIVQHFDHDDGLHSRNCWGNPILPQEHLYVKGRVSLTGRAGSLSLDAMWVSVPLRRFPSSMVAAAGSLVGVLLVFSFRGTGLVVC